MKKLKEMWNRLTPKTRKIVVWTVVILVAAAIGSMLPSYKSEKPAGEVVKSTTTDASVDRVVQRTLETKANKEVIEPLYYLWLTDEDRNIYHCTALGGTEDAFICPDLDLVDPETSLIFDYASHANAAFYKPCPKCCFQNADIAYMTTYAFVADKSTKIFHLEGCELIQKGDKKFKSYEDAIEYNYRPCKQCIGKLLDNQ
ncbi:MAG TPA: hypothetical protein PLP35_09095 [Caldisericia bacterium]|nr:hypothetical protein [Caldisericia bacterium]HPF49835.1 hypothetical protein [Caldisericia bacterium]